VRERVYESRGVCEGVCVSVCEGECLSVCMRAGQREREKEIFMHVCSECVQVHGCACVCAAWRWKV